MLKIYNLGKLTTTDYSQLFFDDNQLELVKQIVENRFAQFKWAEKKCHWTTKKEKNKIKFQFRTDSDNYVYETIIQF